MASEIGVAENTPPPVPGRPAPSVPSRPAPSRPAPARPHSNEGWAPLKMSSAANPPAKKRPVIEVVDARPMSQVGFRDAKASTASPPDRKALPPPPKRPGGPPPSRPKSMVPTEQVSGISKPPRPTSLHHSKPDTAQLIHQEPTTFENDAFAVTPTDSATNPCLIDFDNEPVTTTTSNNLYPDLLASLNSQPDVAVAHKTEEEEEEDKPARVLPSPAMSQLASIMTHGFKKRADSDDEGNNHMEKEGSGSDTSGQADLLCNKPLPSVPAPRGKPLPSAPAPGHRPLPSVPPPGNRPLPSAPAPGNRPLPSAPAPGNRPLPSAPAPGNRPPLPSAPAPGNRPPLPSAPAPGNRPPSFGPAPSKLNGAPPAIPSRSNIPPPEKLPSETSSDDAEPDGKLTHPPKNAAMAQLAAVMKQGRHQAKTTDSEEEDKQSESFASLLQSPAKSEFQDSFFSENEQSVMEEKKEEEEEVSKPPPVQRNPALSSLASVFNSAPQKPTAGSKPAPTMKPKPLPPTKPKPSLKPKPATKPKPGVLPKPGMRGSSSAMANLAAVMRGDNADSQETVQKVSPRLPQSHSDCSGFLDKQSESQPSEKAAENKTDASRPAATKSESRVSAAHRQFGAPWRKPEEEKKDSSDEEVTTRKDERESPSVKEQEEPTLIPKKPGPAPMRATYRPTIIKPTAAKPKVDLPVDLPVDEPNNNTQAQDPFNKKLDTKAASMMSLDSKTEATTDEPILRAKKRPTIIRPPSMHNLSTPTEEEPKRPEPRPIPRDRPRPTPRSRMSAAISMPNIAQESAMLSLQTIDFEGPQKNDPPQKPPSPAVLRGGPPARPRPPSVHGAHQAAPRGGHSMMNLSVSADVGHKEAAPGKKPPPRPMSGPRRASIGSGSVDNVPRQLGLPPALPNRPGPGHPLYHYVVSGPHAIAVYDYEAAQEGDLSFKAGDVIQLSRRVDDEWLEGSCEATRTSGMFPAIFVDVIEPPPETAASGSQQPHHHEQLPDPDPAPSAGPAITGPRCVARYDYESDDPADLCFHTGDTIRLLSWVGEDWLKGELRDREGIFPITFVEVVEEIPREEEHKEQHEEHVRHAADGHEENTVTALYDFQGDSGDLTFKAGEKIQVLSQVSAEWLYGQLGTDKGQFPATFVERIPDNLPQYQPQQQENEKKEEEKREEKSAEQASPLGTCTAMFPYPGDGDDDLGFPQGAIITILEYIDEDWMKGKVDGATGIFPKAFVQIDAPSDAAPSVAAVGEAEAQYDFSAPNDGDLAFRAGDKITLLEVLDEAWMRGELNGQQGVFPASFVTVTKPLE